ncbi:hypothetical protein BJ508DRAFT_300379 [Ascobolus immersus RN42]|uniref:Uncharacterized protein n=1 Tax=Ascobolus immersus RN42 TaxID=1160509 RepID=A0A3N4IP91_ASCIM|nr:hypothetical protein BJ508DRAFT_300379 [Ascobolus immersus RN42]
MFATATPTFLPLAPTHATARQCSSSNLKRRYDSPPESPTLSSYADAIPKRRRNPIRLPGSDTYLNVSKLGPPTFESKNPRFAPMGSLTTGTYGYQPTASQPADGQPQSALASSKGPQLQSANPYATPVNTPTHAHEDIDMMDMEMNESIAHQPLGGTNDGTIAMTQHQTVRSRDITPIPDEVNEKAAEMIKKGKLKLLIGHRADCDRCQKREPGHYTHLVYSG